MEPIISPWLFYFAEVGSTIVVTSVVISVSLFLVSVLHSFDDNDDLAVNILKKNLKPFLPLFIITALLVCFVPSKHTAYKMIVASVVTENNINYAENNMVEFISNIAKALESKGDKNYGN